MEGIFTLSLKYRIEFYICIRYFDKNYLNFLIDMFHQITGSIRITTKGPNLIEITKDIMHWLKIKECLKGLLNIHIMHTSASLIVQENADSTVLEDIIEYYSNSVPSDYKYKHNTEGEDDMPAHIKSSLTLTSISLSVQAKSLMLGTWQGIYLFEHRQKSQTREINLHFIGE